MKHKICFCKEKSQSFDNSYEGNYNRMVNDSMLLKTEKHILKLTEINTEWLLYQYLHLESKNQVRE